MTRPFLAAALFLAFPLMALPAAAAEPADAAPGDKATVLHLSEQAQRMVARDRLRAVLRADGTDTDAARLQAAINQRMAAAVARAKGVPGVTIFTSGYSVYQEQLKDQPPHWRGMASLTLTAPQAVPLLALIGTLQQSGMLVSSLAYELTPEAARMAEDDLTSEALARLRRRADLVAQSLGLVVERIRDLRLGNAAGTQPVPRPFMAAGIAQGAAPPPIAEPGEATVTVSVDADVQLGPKR